MSHLINRISSFSDNSDYNKIFIGRRKLLKIALCTGVGLATPIIVKESAEAGWGPLIKATITGLNLASAVFRFGQAVGGVVDLFNNTNRVQEGIVIVDFGDIGSGRQYRTGYSFSLSPGEPLPGYFEASLPIDSGQKWVMARTLISTSERYEFTYR